MPDPDLAYWKDIVRRSSGRAGHRLSADAIDELASHLADVYAAQRAEGRSQDEAQAVALGTAEQGAYHDVAGCARAGAGAESHLLERVPSRSARLAGGLTFDVRYAWRSMWRQPAFTLALVTILTVSIGASTAAYAVIDAVLLRPLPYPDASQLVVLKHVTPGEESRAFAAADWLDYQSRHASSLSLAAYSSWPMNLTGGAEPERLRSVIVSGEFFDVLGRQPALGRVSSRADDQPGAEPVVVLSHEFWRRRFGGDAAAIGRSVVVNGASAAVIGVMTSDFGFPHRDVDLWMPMRVAPAVLADRASEWLSVFGRLQRGADPHSAQADLAVTAAALEQAYPKTNRDERALIRPLLQEMVGGASRPVWLGGVAVLFVLLAGCANAVNLMIGRATLRRDEMALRAGLGADPWRIGRQLFVESAVLTAVGGTLGVGAAALFLRAFVALAGDRVPRVHDVSLSTPSLAVAVLTSLGVTLVFGGITAWFVARTVSAGPGHTGAVQVTTHSRLGTTLLTAQVALAFILLAAASMVGGSYAAAARMDAGFDTPDTLTFQLTLSRSRYPDTAAHVRFAERVLAEVSTIPGVSSAGIVSDLPFVGNALHFRVGADGASPDSMEQMTVRPADAGYLRTLRIPLLEGRRFVDEDRADGEPVAILNRTAAERLEGVTGVGGRLRIAGEPARVVVGVVGDTRHDGLGAEEGPVVYVPYAQKSFGFLNWMGVVIRGAGVERSAPALRAAVARVDADQPLQGLRTMTDYVAAEAAPLQFGSLVIGTLAATTLLLAMTGIYGMTAFVVGRRSREFGVRLALGATRGRIVQLVMGRMAVSVTAGTILGAGGAVVANKVLGATLADAGATAGGVAPLLLGAALLTLAAVAASLGPAFRAARTDPRSALQTE
jgi:putative ABC transport system permease protein